MDDLTALADEQIAEATAAELGRRRWRATHHWSNCGSTSPQRPSTTPGPWAISTCRTPIARQPMGSRPDGCPGLGPGRFTAPQL